MNEKISIRISDVYAHIGKNKIVNWWGYGSPNSNSQSDLINGKSSLFVKGNNLLSELRINKNNYLISFVVPGLRILFNSSKYLLSSEEQLLLDISSKRDLPSFFDVGDYDDVSTDKLYTTFQLMGSITPYDILSLPVKEFKRRINSRIPILFTLEETNVNVEITFENYDFWDESQKRLVLTV